MKKEDLFESFDALDPELIAESENFGGNMMENRKKKSLKKSIAAVAAAAAVLIAVPNLSASAAEALGNIPVLGKIIEAVTFRDYSEEEEHRKIDLEVPEVVVDGESADEINADIEKIAEELMAEYTAAAEKEDPNISLSMNYEILNANEKYFTLKLNCFKALGGGYEWNEFYTLDRATGERLALSDLFADGADYVTPISGNILAQMKEQMAADEGKMYFLDEVNPDDNFTAIAPDQNFYLNADGELVIAFDEYEVAPGYMGTVEFTIPAAVTEAIPAK